MLGRRGFHFAALGVVLVPAGLLAGRLLAYSVNIPYMDQWEVADLVVKAFDGTLSLRDLTSQQNETRLFFPRLVFIGLAYLTGYDVRYEMWGSFCLACLIVYNVYRLGRLTLGGTYKRALFLLFLASAMIFSLGQWENWFWGIQFVVFIPIACVTSILSLASSSRSVGTKFAASIALATISTFSFSIGIVCWVVVLPVLVLQTWETLKTKTWLLGCWGCAFALNVGLYFLHYVPPLHHPSFTEALMQPLAACAYFLAFLGAPLGWGARLYGLYQTIAVGCGIVILFVVLCRYIWWHRHESLVLYRTLGWLMLGTYTLVSAGVATLGRLELGVHMALSSRYIAFSFPLIVALIYLTPIVLDIHGAPQASWGKRWRTRVMTVLSSVLILLYLVMTMRALAVAEANWRNRLQAKGALHFIRTLPNASLTHTMYPNLEALTRSATGLDRHGLLAPGLRKSLSIASEELRQTTGMGECGWFDVLQGSGGETYIAKGSAMLVHRRAPADGIVLAYEEADGTFTIFDLAMVQLVRPRVAQAFPWSRAVHAAWEHSFILPQVGEQSVKLAAWALDANTGQLCKLRKVYVVDAQASEIREAEP